MDLSVGIKFILFILLNLLLYDPLFLLYLLLRLGSPRRKCFVIGIGNMTES
jgi:hypothetical protein